MKAQKKRKKRVPLVSQQVARDLLWQCVTAHKASPIMYTKRFNRRRHPQSHTHTHCHFHHHYHHHHHHHACALSSLTCALLPS